MTQLEEKINKHVDFIGSDFTEEGKKQLRKSYKDIATQAVEGERQRILKELPKIIFQGKYSGVPVFPENKVSSVGGDLMARFCLVGDVRSLINKSNT